MFVTFSELSLPGIIQNVLFCVWLLSLGKMFVRFIHIACQRRHHTLLLVGVWSVSSLQSPWSFMNMQDMGPHFTPAPV